MRTFILILFCLLIGFLAGIFKSTVDYDRGVSDGIDTALSITEKSNLELRSTYSEAKARYFESKALIDSVIADYEAMQTESFPNHSEIKP